MGKFIKGHKQFAAGKREQADAMKGSPRLALASFVPSISRSDTRKPATR
jgi:hypothetical protein